MQDYSEIIQKARQLSDMINNHEITIKYRESLEKIRGDVNSQRLLSELVRIGREISENMNVPDGQKSFGKAELEMLQHELDSGIIVKEHLVIQRQYLDMIKQVQDRIKNPVDED